MATLTTAAPGSRTTEAGSRANGRLFNKVHARLFGPPELPDSIGPYRGLKTIGAGGMGVVYEAIDPALGRRVAVKVLFERSAAASARFVREARAMARLNHDNVVTIYDVGQSDVGPYIAMELVDGVTLRKWLRMPRSVAEIAEVMRQAGAGLAAAHARGLVHRDFKPDNVLVGRDGRVRVADFGLATAVDVPPAVSALTMPLIRSDEWEGVTRTGTVMGTPAYMGPEQFEGQPASPRTDQFAFCVVLFEALYGKRPFAGASLPEAVARMRAGRVAPVLDVRGVPAKLHRALLRGLSADPAQRLGGLAPLLGLLAGATQPAGDTDVSPDRRRWWSRVPWVRVVASTLATLLPHAWIATVDDDPGPTVLEVDNFGEVALAEPGEEDC